MLSSLLISALLMGIAGGPHCMAMFTAGALQGAMELALNRDMKNLASN
jgi:hypothetical protein